MDRLNRRASLGEVLGANRDEQGRIVLGDPKLGCPHCGTINVKHSPGPPETILYHPGIECCEQRLADEIGWRIDEQTGIHKRQDEDNEHLATIRDTIDLARPHERGRAEKVYERSLRIQNARNATYQNKLDELNNEVTRLRKKAKEMAK